MSRHRTARVAGVLAGALRVWGVPATVEDADGFVVRAPSTTLRIVAGAPRGWLVFRDGDLLAMHAGLPGLLRSLRRELAPHAAAGRLVIGTQELA
jgi:hypothetical protein